MTDLNQRVGEPEPEPEPVPPDSPSSPLLSQSLHIHSNIETTPWVLRPWVKPANDKENVNDELEKI